MLAANLATDLAKDNAFVNLLEGLNCLSWVFTTVVHSRFILFIIKTVEIECAALMRLLI